jgi:hypothetical protein
MRYSQAFRIRNGLPILSAVFMVVLFSACRPRSISPAYPTVGFLMPPASTFTPPVTKTLGAGGEFDLGKAMRLLYGAEGTLETGAQGEPVVRIAGVPGSNDPRDKIIKPLLAAGYREAGEEKFILLTETGPEGMGAHAEYAQIGGALFHKPGDAWEIEIEQREITWMGSFGHAPAGEVQAIGPDKNGFLFKPQWAGQGSVVQNAILIGVVGPEFKVLFIHEIRIHSEVGGAVWDYSSAMEFIPGDHAEYFDIRMTSRGTKPVDGKVAPFELVEVFEFNGLEFVSAG